MVGVAKAGTTNLHSLLARHPQVFMSTPKEPHFLAAPQTTQEAAHTLNVIRDESSYISLFADAVEPIRGESSTTNWWRPETAARIDAFSPGSRVIVILRDPVERAFSHYLNDVRESIESRPFGETLTDSRPGEGALRWGDPDIRIELGFYADRLAAYRETFGDRLLVLFADDLFADADAQMRAISEFLGLTRDSLISSSDHGTNAHRMPRGRLARRALRSPLIRAAGRRIVPSRVRQRAYELLMHDVAKPRMDPRSRERLRRLYAADSAKLESVLGCPPRWKASEAR
ncbi:MAG: sulfotransferase [Solirubrobacterales bacterium]